MKLGSLLLPLVLLVVAFSCGTCGEEATEAQSAATRAASLATEAAADATRAAAAATCVAATQIAAQTTLTPTDEPSPTATFSPTLAPIPRVTATAVPTLAWETAIPVTPTLATIAMADGTETVLVGPLSIEGAVETGCGWQLEALDASGIREFRRQQDGQYVLVNFAGDEVPVSPGRSAVLGKDQWGQKRVELADTTSVRFEGGSPGAAIPPSMLWVVSDECGNRIIVGCPSASDWTTRTCLPVFRLTYGAFASWIDPQSLTGLTQVDARGGRFQVRLSDGAEISGASLPASLRLVGQAPFGHAAIPVARTRSISASPAPVGATIPPEWRLTDDEGKVLDVTLLELHGALLAESGLAADSVDFSRVLGVTSVSDGLTLQLPSPFGATPLISGTLSGAWGPGLSFDIAIADVRSIERRSPTPIPAIPTAGKLTLTGNREIAVSMPPDSAYDSPESLVGAPVEFVFADPKTGPFQAGFRIWNELLWVTPCTASGVCPAGRPSQHQGEPCCEEPAHWEYGGAVRLTIPYADIVAYTVAESPEPSVFTPTVSLTVVGRKGDSVTYRVSNLQFVQIRRPSARWCCSSPSAYIYDSMSVIGLADGVTRTVDIASLTRLDFDEPYGAGVEDLLAMRLTCDEQSPLDVRLDPANPPDHPAFYWDRSREGLTANAGDGIQVIIPFSEAKRIDLRPLE